MLICATTANATANQGGFMTFYLEEELQQPFSVCHEKQ